MAEGKAQKPWSILNEAHVLAALRSDSTSEYWGTCYEFVQYVLEKLFPKFQTQAKEDIVQDILLLVHRNVATFRGQSQLTTWLVSIVRNRTIDILRQGKNNKLSEVFMDELPEVHEDTCVYPFSPIPRTPEVYLLTQERLQEAQQALEEYLQMHRKVARNRNILQLVLYDGYSQEEASHMLGIPAPVIGHVVRAAREYVRQKLAE